MKKQMMLVLLAVLTISILPGCGKSKNDDGSIIGSGVGTIPAIGQGSGGCYDVRNVYGSGITLGFAGTISQGTGIQAHLPLHAAAAGIPGGYTNTYYRTTSYGDRTDIAISGSSAYVQASVSSYAVSLAQQYGGQICGFYMNVSILSTPMNGPAWQGNVGGGLFGVVTSSNYVIQL